MNANIQVVMSLILDIHDAINALFMPRPHRSHHALLSSVESFALACGWKNWMNLVGVYRPMWLALVEAKEGGLNIEGRASFPSGHSAYMFCTMTVLTLWLCGQTKILSAAPKVGIN